ncbi:MAG: class II fructose-bisphosphate aldolase [Opitutaceae bacterium]
MDIGNYKSQLERMLLAKKAMLAFNIQNIYHLEALESVARELDAPVIAQVSAKYIEDLDDKYGLSRLVQKFQTGFLFFHLDHCMEEEIIRRCIDAGFAGVMFDGSSLPLSENIKKTNRMFEYAQVGGSLLEAELGSIQGVEDGYGSEEECVYSEHELAQFYKNARFDLLALAIGNAHGEYVSTTGVRIELLEEAKRIVGDFPLVLHGGTGLPDEMIHEAIRAGVVKINVSTALKSESMKALNFYQNNFTSYDERKFSEVCIDTFVPFFRSYISKYSI